MNNIINIAEMEERGEEAIYTQLPDIKYNISKRVIYCQFCNFKVLTAMAGAQCRKCNSDMITYVR